MENFRIENIQKALQPSKVEKTDKPNKGTSVSKTRAFNSLEFSAQGTEFRAALKAIRQAPDVREDKIRQLQEDISQGKFDLVDDLVAEKLLKQIFGNIT